MASTDKLGIVLVEQAQAQKESTVNEAIAILDAMHGRSTKSVSTGTVALTEAEAQTGLLVLTGSKSGDVELQYPDTIDGQIFVLNSSFGSGALTIRYGASGTIYTLPQYQLALFSQGGITFIGGASLEGLTSYLSGYGGGVTKVYRYVGEPVTPLPTSGWSARGTGLTTARLDSNGLYVSKAATAGENVCAYCRTAPSTPYTITAKLTANIFNVATMRAGLCWYDGTKFICWGWLQTGGIMASKYDNATTKTGASPDFGFVSSFSTPYMWLKITDNGTNLIIYNSYNGFDYQQIDSSSRTAFMGSGPTEVGVFVNPNNASWACGMHVHSWAQS